MNTQQCPEVRSLCPCIYILAEALCLLVIGTSYTTQGMVFRRTNEEELAVILMHIGA